MREMTFSTADVCRTCNDCSLQVCVRSGVRVPQVTDLSLEPPTPPLASPRRRCSSKRRTPLDLLTGEQLDDPVCPSPVVGPGGLELSAREYEVRPPRELGIMHSASQCSATRMRSRLRSRVRLLITSGCTDFAEVMSDICTP
jgi:hypothetical protein